MVDCETKRQQVVDGCKRLPATAVRPRRPAIIDVMGYDTAESGMLVVASLAATAAGHGLNVVASASASSILPPKLKSRYEWPMRAHTPASACFVPWGITGCPQRRQSGASLSCRFSGQEPTVTSVKSGKIWALECITSSTAPQCYATPARYREESPVDSTVLCNQT
ncbi:hypothetical protein COCVIDRAFT_16928 [Bipolaris victoriae FI3]|uniref:Uncharacterized protein n=2 Tax=Bipolaris TaxID=33194 RepID=W6YV80_COCC2|nr:uncharacterized protein COCCADRAFT_21470 [Bipolaris zeicola 26-R-13]XP_014555488.1 hypothetical protein COCVIDRAFT_16928 [Bipolaris victoriae FI3]EUC39404.1 hypothetical protein COCCADRAFT_21470 [Bipolaris zeicola 26-R-13]